MIQVNQIRQYGQRVQQEIESINFNRTIIDDSQIVKNLSSVSPDDNLLFYLVIPSMHNEGTDDSFRKNNDMMFLVLKKVDRNQGHEAFLDVMQETQIASAQIEAMMYDDHDRCGALMQFLDVASVSIDPIWGMAQCHGWSISFNMTTKIS